MTEIKETFTANLMAKAGKCAVNTNIHLYVSFANVMCVNNILKMNKLAQFITYIQHMTYPIASAGLQLAKH